MAIALLSSYLQQRVLPNSLFVGELDLTSRIRRPDPNYLAELALGGTLAAGADGSPLPLTTGL